MKYLAEDLVYTVSRVQPDSTVKKAGHCCNTCQVAQSANKDFKITMTWNAADHADSFRCLFCGEECVVEQ